ncbi:MAG: GIY-YIG nuclease family protein, partial [Ignavibacteriae bacterium]|nr:GIY-YIG nuclease family protein [Ignavibacteriota bacterium]
YVYILQSELDGSYYVGYSHDVELRLVHHNDGWTTSTKAKRPWKIVYVEPAASKGDAIKRSQPSLLFPLCAAK